MLNESFNILKSNLELKPTFAERVQIHHNAIRGALRNIDGSIDTKLIGSVGRQTRIQPRASDLFDIDILVILGQFDAWTAFGGVTPDAAMQRALSLVQQSERYASMDPTPDHPTISVEYQDNIKVELVPSYRDNVGAWPDGRAVSPKGRGYWVPKRGQWEFADYDFDATVLTTLNQSHNCLVIPAIKMLKALRRRYFANLGSFHFEILAARTIPAVITGLRAQQLAASFPLMIQVFFNVASTLPIDAAQFPGSNSPAVFVKDGTGQGVLNMWTQISNYCDAISGSERQQCQQWRELFGDEFPAV
jgi:hypothetical protein